MRAHFIGCPVDFNNEPVLTGTVSITGTAKYGEVLTAIPSLTNGGTVTYQWERESDEITGAIRSTYTLAEADIGSVITVVVTADSVAGTGSITSNGTEAVTKLDGPSAPSGSIVGEFPTEATSIELSSLAPNVSGLELAIAVDGTTYDSYAELSVDEDGKATIAGLSGITNSTKVKIRVKETATTLAGIVKEILVTNEFAVGAIGPSGGYIFYDKGDYTDGWRYLEAAPAGWGRPEHDPIYRYGNYRPAGGISTEVGGIETAIGAGKANTVALIEAMGEEAYIDYINPTKSKYAAKVCADFVLTKNGIVYDDWFLPSKDELNQIYHNLRVERLGNFSTTNNYLSSSESSAGGAWSQYFDNGHQTRSNRTNEIAIRPVRAF